MMVLRLTNQDKITRRRQELSAKPTSTKQDSIARTVAEETKISLSSLIIRNQSIRPPSRFNDFDTKRSTN